jgi:hypothetical protein
VQSELQVLLRLHTCPEAMHFWTRANVHLPHGNEFGFEGASQDHVCGETPCVHVAVSHGFRQQCHLHYDREAFTASPLGSLILLIHSSHTGDGRLPADAGICNSCNTFAAVVQK